MTDDIVRARRELIKIIWGLGVDMREFIYYIKQTKHSVRYCMLIDFQQTYSK